MDTHKEILYVSGKFFASPHQSHRSRFAILNLLFLFDKANINMRFLSMTDVAATKKKIRIQSVRWNKSEQSAGFPCWSSLTFGFVRHIGNCGSREPVDEYSSWQSTMGPEFWVQQCFAGIMPLQSHCEKTKSRAGDCGRVYRAGGHQSPKFQSRNRR